MPTLNFLIASAGICLEAVIALFLLCKFMRAKRADTVLLAALFAAMCAGDAAFAFFDKGAGSAGFKAGLAAFMCAQITLIAFFRARENSFSKPMFCALAAPYALFFAVLIAPKCGFTPQCAAYFAYALLSIASVSFAAGKSRAAGMGFFALAVAAMFYSDTMIAVRSLLKIKIPSEFVSIPYFFAIFCFVCGTAVVLKNGGKPHEPPTPRRLTRVALCATALAAAMFCVAMASVKGYNPAMRMLSYLGRTEIGDAPNGAGMAAFMGGMFCSAAALFIGLGALKQFVDKKLQKWFLAGVYILVCGFATVMLSPENLTYMPHQIGCFLLLAGGVLAVVGTSFSKKFIMGGSARHVWFGALMAFAAAFGCAMILSSFKIVPFAPYVTFTQKLVIVGFAAWATVPICMLAFAKAVKKH